MAKNVKSFAEIRPNNDDKWIGGQQISYWLHDSYEGSSISCVSIKSVIRSVLEYGSVVWHHHLIHAQSDKLEAFFIIFYFFCVRASVCMIN